METINITSYFDKSYSPSFIVWDGSLLWGHGDNFAEAVLSALDCYSEQRECSIWDALKAMNECAVYERQEADWLCIGSLNDTVLDVITWVGHDLDSVNNLGDKWPGVRERVVVSNVEGRGCPASVDEAVKVVRKFLAEGCNAGNADGIALVESGSCTWELRYSLEEKRNKMFDLAWEILNVEILDDGDVYVTPHGGTTEDGLFIITSEEIHELAELLLKHRGSGKGWKQDAWVEWCDSGEPLTKWEGK